MIQGLPRLVNYDGRIVLLGMGKMVIGIGAKFRVMVIRHLLDDEDNINAEL